MRAHVKPPSALRGSRARARVRQSRALEGARYAAQEASIRSANLRVAANAEMFRDPEFQDIDPLDVLRKLRERGRGKILADEFSYRIVGEYA